MRATRSWMKRRAKRKAPARKTVHLFSGLAHCVCGEKMYPEHGSKKYICRSCRNKIRIDDLEAIFHEQLRNLFGFGRFARHADAIS